MVGDHRVRHCGQCNRNVYDLTAMHEAEAEAFLQAHLATTGTLPCARLYRRPDGRLTTSPCATAIDQRNQRRAMAAVAAAAVIVAAGAREVVMHTPAMSSDGTVVVERGPDGVIQTEPEENQLLVGVIAVPYLDDGGGSPH
jgi:hypothetical protein